MLRCLAYSVLRGTKTVIAPQMNVHMCVRVRKYVCSAMQRGCMQAAQNRNRNRCMRVCSSRRLCQGRGWCSHGLSDHHLTSSVPQAALHVLERWRLMSEANQLEVEAPSNQRRPGRLRAQAVAEEERAEPSWLMVRLQVACPYLMVRLGAVLAVHAVLIWQLSKPCPVGHAMLVLLACIL